MSEPLVQLAAFAVFAVLAVAVLTRPWWSRAVAAGLARRSANLAAYRSRIAEIDRDVEAGVIPATEAEALKRETGARLLGDTQGEDAAAVEAAARPRSPLIAVVIAVLAVGVAGAWYGLGGSWRVERDIADGASPSAAAAAQVQAMVEGLAARLKQNPEDVEGWSRLGRAYFVLQRYSDSAQAYHQANARNGGKDADMLAAEGEALAFAHQLDIPPQAATLFQRALQLSPDDGRALWYGGLAAAQAGDKDTARSDWTRLRQRELPDRMRDLLDRAIAQLDHPQTAETEAPPAAAASSSGAAPAAGATKLVLKINVAPALATQIQSGDTLFVFAKAASGPPMPLAVYRAPAGRFPVEVTLDDSMAMAPALRLSAFEHYLVTARISRSGQAQPQPGDLQGSAKLDRPSSAEAAANASEIVIDQVVR